MMDQRAINRATEVRLVTITEVDAPNLTILARDEFGGTITIGMHFAGDVITLPGIGERWTVERSGNQFFLGQRASLDATLGFSSMVAGDKRIDTPGTLHLEAAEVMLNGLPLSSLVPTGVILPYGGSVAPVSYLLADGLAHSRTTYAGLFSVIGTAYGVGDGSTTFNVPNLKGKVAVGRDAAQVEFDVLGETGGVKTVALITGELPAHSHPVTGSPGISDPGHDHGVPSNHRVLTTSGSQIPDTGAGNYNVTSTDVNPASTGISVNVGTLGTSNTGSGTAHNNLQPYIVANHIIKT